MKILVYGFYSKSNLGDQYFIQAFQKLFTEYEFTFSDKITEELFHSHDALFLGGGSFLDGQPKVHRDLLEKLPLKPILYIGVGAETDIHPWHKFLIRKASLVAIRSSKSLDKIKDLNKNTIVIPDLVYSLADKSLSAFPVKKSILYLPNSHNVSKWNDAAWKSSSWEYFKSECAQTFEYLINNGHSIDVLPMCSNSQHKDEFAAAEILNKMTSGSLNFLPFKEHSFSSLLKIFSKYELVISQRFHGLILSDMLGTPCINIHHHDKLKEFYSPFSKKLNYYGLSKSEILSAIDDAIFVRSLKISDDNIGINSNVFEDLKEKVSTILIRD